MADLGAEPVVIQTPASIDARTPRLSRGGVDARFKRKSRSYKIRADGAVLVKKSHPGCGVEDPVTTFFSVSPMYLQTTNARSRRYESESNTIGITAAAIVSAVPDVPTVWAHAGHDS